MPVGSYHQDTIDVAIDLFGLIESNAVKRQQVAQDSHPRMSQRRKRPAHGADDAPRVTCTLHTPPHLLHKRNDRARRLRPCRSCQ